MIDIEKTINLRGYDPLMLTHGSSKKVWANCDICGKGRWVIYNQYSNFCLGCALKQPKRRDDLGKIMKQYYIDNPEAREEARLKSLEQWDQKACDEQSIRIINSEAMQVEHEKQKGGNDICKHHYIYDHSDLSKYTMKMTRATHTRLHNNMRKAGIKVPHINVKGEQ